MSSEYYYKVLQKFRQSYKEIGDLKNYASAFSIVRELCLLHPAIERLQCKQNSSVVQSLRFYFSKVIAELLNFFKDPLNKEIRSKLNEYFGNYLSNLVLIYQNSCQSSLIHLKGLIRKIKKSIFSILSNGVADNGRSGIPTMLFTLCEELKISFDKTATRLILFRISLDILLMQFIYYAYGFQSDQCTKQTANCAKSVCQLEFLIKENSQQMGIMDLKDTKEYHDERKSREKYCGDFIENKMSGENFSAKTTIQKNLGIISSADQQVLAAQFLEITKKLRSSSIDDPENHKFIKGMLKNHEKVVQRLIFWELVEDKDQLWNSFARLKIINEKIHQLRKLKTDDDQKYEIYTAVEKYLTMIWKRVYFCYLEEMHVNMDFEYFYGSLIDEMFNNMNQCINFMRCKDANYKVFTGMAINRVNYALCFVRDFMRRKLHPEVFKFYYRKIVIIRKTYIKNLLIKFGELMHAEGEIYSQIIDEFEHLSVKLFGEYEVFRFSYGVQKPTFSSQKNNNFIKGKILVATEFKNDYNKNVIINGMLYQFKKDNAFNVLILNDSGDVVIQTLSYSVYELNKLINYLKLLPANTCIIVSLMINEWPEKKQLRFMTNTNSKLSFMIEKMLPKDNDKPFIGMMIGYIDENHVITWQSEEFLLLNSSTHQIIKHIPSLLEKKNLMKIELSCSLEEPVPKRSIRINNQEYVIHYCDNNDAVVCIQEMIINNRTGVLTCSSNTISRILSVMGKGNVVMGIMNGNLIYNQEKPYDLVVDFSQCDIAQTLFIAVKQIFGNIVLRHKTINQSGDLVLHINTDSLLRGNFPFHETDEDMKTEEKDEESENVEYVIDISKNKNNESLAPFFEKYSEIRLNVSEMIQNTILDAEAKANKDDDIFDSFTKLNQLINHLIDLIKNKGPLRTDLDVIKNCQEIKKQAELLFYASKSIRDKCISKSILENIDFSIDNMKLFLNQLHVISCVNKRDSTLSLKKRAENAAEKLLVASTNMLKSSLTLVKDLQSVLIENHKKNKNTASWTLSHGSFRQSSCEKAEATVKKSISDIDDRKQKPKILNNHH